jgi:hypothetical protein
MGWAGFDCNHTVCFGVPQDHINATCSGHGACIRPDICNCTMGFYGQKCEFDPNNNGTGPNNGTNNGNNTLPCFGKGPDDPQVCSSKGQCVQKDVCNCFPGFNGQQCEQPVNNNGNGPNNNGTGPNNNGTNPNMNGTDPNNNGTNNGNSTLDCFGKRPDDPQVCNSKGNCTQKDICNCFPGFIGQQCEQPANNNGTGPNNNGTNPNMNGTDPNNNGTNNGNNTLSCFGKRPDDPQVCNSKGNCTQKDVCHCFPGFVGQQCEQPANNNGTDPNNNGTNTNNGNSTLSCFGKRPDDPQVCSSKGQCVQKDVCNCFPGFIGQQCEQPANNNGTGPNMNGTDPNNNGTINGNSTLDCFGKKPGDPQVCNSKGQCVQKDVCNCFPGFVGQQCEQPANNNGTGPNNNGTNPNMNGTDPNNNGTNNGNNTLSCFGKRPDDPQVCSSKGQCVQKDTCNCFPGFIGQQCEQPANNNGTGPNNNGTNNGNSTLECFGKKPDDVQVCSSKGQCVQPDICMCFPGFTGKVCEISGGQGNGTNGTGDSFECFGKSRNDPQVCSSKGNCVQKDVCNCFSGFVGKQCEQPANNNGTGPNNGTDNNNSTLTCFGIRAEDPTVCHNRGKCIAQNQCQCASDFLPPTCEKPVNNNGTQGGNSTLSCYGKKPDDPQVCNSKGQCIQPDTCTCFPGFVGKQCETSVNNNGTDQNNNGTIGDFQCFDKKKNDPNVCSSKGNCIQKDICVCFQGFSGKACEISGGQGNGTQVAECYGFKENDPMVCSGNGKCTGKDTCVCRQGFAGMSCESALCNGTRSDSPSVCGGHGYCIKPDNCMCYYGYGGPSCTSSTCGQILNTDPKVCNARGICRNGACICASANYTGDLCQYTTCSGKSPLDPRVCSGRGQCQDGNCKCTVGFSGVECQNFEQGITFCYGKAAQDDSVCRGHGYCNSTNVCVCNDNYSGEQCQYRSCFGQVENSGKACSARGQCVGVNECQCFPGYAGDKCQNYKCYGRLSTDSMVCGGGNSKCIGPDVCQCADSGYSKNCSVTVCGDRYSDDVSVCSGKGKCTKPNQCTCDANTKGNNCEQTLCYNYMQTDSRVCSGHGMCDGPNNCLCAAGYVGDDCSRPLCFGKAANDSTACGGHGICVGANRCACSSNYGGVDCTRCAPNFDGYPQCSTQVCNGTITCNGHGNCGANLACVCYNNATDGFFAGPFCDQCSKGYSGANCKKQCDNRETCNNRGECNTDGTCVCYQTSDGVFNGTNCNVCADGWYGNACRTSSPKDFKFRNDASSLTGTWYADTAIGLADCGRFIHADDVVLLGDRPICGFADVASKKTGSFIIKFGANSKLTPSGSLRFNVVFNDQTQPKYISATVAAPDQGPTVNAMAFAPSLVSVCDSVTLDGSASYSSDGRGLTFAWTSASSTVLNSYLVTQKNQFVVVPSSVVPSGTSTVQLIVTNFLNVQSSPVTVSFSKSTDAVAQARIRGPARQVTRRGDFFRLDAVGDIGACFYENNKLVFTFAQTSGLAVTSRKESQALLFDPKSFPAVAATYEFSVTVQPVANMDASTTASVTVEVTLANLIAAISGGDRAISNNIALVLDASVSIDPEQSSDTPSYLWSCFDTLYNGDCPTEIRNALVSTASTVTIPKNSTAGKYQFGVVYSKGTRSDQTYVTIEIIQVVGNDVFPSVRFEDSLLLKSSLPQNQALYTFKASISTPDTVTQVKWYYDGSVVTASEDYSILSIVDGSEKYTKMTKNSQPSFGEHTLRVEVTTRVGTAYAVYQFDMGLAPPTPGSIAVPNNVSMLSEVTFVASQWTIQDCGSSCTLYYQWYIVFNGKELIRTQKLLSNIITLPGLPPGSLTIGLNVFNSEGSSTTIESDVVVKTQSNCMSVISPAVIKLQSMTGYAVASEANLFSAAIAASLSTCTAISRKLMDDKSDAAKAILSTVTSRFDSIDSATPFDNAFYSEFGSTVNSVVQSGSADSQTQATALSLLNNIVSTVNKAANTESLDHDTATLFVDAVTTIAKNNPSLLSNVSSIVGTVLSAASGSAEYQGRLSPFITDRLTISTGTFAKTELAQTYSVPSVKGSDIIGSTQFKFRSGILSKISDSNVQIQSEIFDKNLSPKAYSENKNPQEGSTILSTNVLSLKITKTDGTVISISGLDNASKITITMAAKFDLTKAYVEGTNGNKGVSGFVPMCKYYDELARKWTSDSTCTVAQYNSTVLVCDCTHLTLFVGTYDYKVAPDVSVLHSSGHLTGKSSEDWGLASVAPSTYNSAQRWIVSLVVLLTALVILGWN